VFHIIVNQRGCCDYCGLPKQFFDLYPNCASKIKESQNTDAPQLIAEMRSLWAKIDAAADIKDFETGTRLMGELRALSSD
jgi:hypothetical protein